MKKLVRPLLSFLIMALVLSLVLASWNWNGQKGHNISSGPALAPANESGTVLFSDNFQSYSPGTSVINHNVGSSTYPQYYIVGEGGNEVGCGCTGVYCGYPAPLGDDWAAKALICDSLNGGAAVWHHPAAWYVAASPGSNPPSSQSLYTQTGDAPDKVTAGFVVDPGLYHVGDIISFEEWVYLGPAFGYSGPAENLAIQDPAGRVNYHNNGGWWDFMSSSCPTTNAVNEYYFLTPGVWHDLKMITQYTGNGGTYISFQIDGLSPFDATLQGKTYACGSNRWSTWSSVTYGTCAQQGPLGSQPLSDGKCYGDWGDHTNTWMYVTNFLATDLGGGTYSSTTGSGTTTSTTNTSPTITQTSFTSGATVWSANFETGDNSQFNGVPQSTCTNGVIGVSSSIVHSGSYAGSYSGQGTAAAGRPSCREHPQENLPQSLTNFYWEMWVYVPSVTLTDWVSFATFSSAANYGTPFTLDSEPNRQIYLDIVGTGYAYQNLGSPVAFPFDTWFKLSVLVHNVASSNADITVYMNGSPILYHTGYLSPGTVDTCHFGLYMGGNNPSFTIHNDDILIETIASTTTSTSTTTSPTTSTTSATTSTTPTQVTSTITSTVTVTNTQTPPPNYTTEIVTITSTNPNYTTTETRTISPLTATTSTALTTATLTVAVATTSSQYFATTTTFTATGVSSEFSYSFTTLTLTGQSTSSVATTSTTIFLTTASVLTTTTQTTVTTSNLLGVAADSASQPTYGIYPEDGLGFFGTLFLLLLMLLRRMHV